MSMFIAPRCYSHVQPTFGSFGGLHRLMEDFDRQLQQATKGHRQVVRHVPRFTPRFDVKETDTSYELHGELPGIEKDNLHIEFSDPQTVVIRGHVDHSYTAGTPLSNLISNATEKAERAADEKETESDDEPVVIDSHDAEETSSTKSFQATVEDEVDEDAQSSTSEPQPTPATTVAEPAKTEERPKPAETPKHKYWVSERSYGQFSRSFALPARVELDAVTASLSNGVLTVNIPKAKKHESRRITVN